MSIIIVTTAQGSTSNSYLTTAEATSYFEQNPLFYSVWDAISNKNTWVTFSAKAIDRLSFRGVRYLSTQSMEFPRDINDDYTTAGEVPQAVKDAQCEMLIYLKIHTDNGTMKPHPLLSSVTNDTAVTTSYFDKDNTMEYTAMGGTKQSVENLLKTWIGASYTARLRRI